MIQRQRAPIDHGNEHGNGMEGAMFRVRQLVTVVVLTVFAAVAGATLAAECGTSSGGGWSSAGCSLEGGSVIRFARQCSGGAGDCYRCQYNCNYGGTEDCVTNADGTNMVCNLLRNPWAI